MTTTPDTETGGSRNRGRWVIIGIVAVIVVAVIAAAAGWYYFYGGEAPAAPTLDNALQQLLPSEPPE